MGLRSLYIPDYSRGGSAVTKSLLPKNAVFLFISGQTSFLSSRFQHAEALSRPRPAPNLGRHFTSHVVVSG
jgi:hypothetical protein